MKEGAIFITHDWPIIRVEFRRLATLYFAARQVGHKRGNTCNRGFQLAMQQCCETIWTKMSPVLPDLNTSLHYTIFQHWKGEWGCWHSFCRCYGYDYFPKQFVHDSSSSPIPEYENGLLVHLFLFHVIYTNGNLALLRISYAKRKIGEH